MSFEDLKKSALDLKKWKDNGFTIDDETDETDIYPSNLFEAIATPEKILELIDMIEQLQAERDALKGEVAMRKDIAAKRFNEGLLVGQEATKRLIKEASDAKENYLNENQRLTNLLLAVENERDVLKARIDGGIRIFAFNDHGHRHVADSSYKVTNATLILDEGVEL